MSAVIVSSPEKNIRASLRLSGSKSISNRLLILREVLQQKFLIHSLSESEDTELLLQALRTLKEGKTTQLNVKHAGTDFRFLTAFLAIRPGGPYTLSGSDRLKERPIAELVSALKQLGADIHYLEKDRHPPLLIYGKNLLGGKIQVKAGISSQFISALLLISPKLPMGLEILLEGEMVSTPYVQMSLALLKHFGVDYEFQMPLIRIFPMHSKKRNFSAFTVEPDWSSASYWYSVCALSQNAEIQLPSFEKNSLQADSCLAEIYTSFGVNTQFRKDGILLSKTPVRVSHFEYDFSDCPDIAPTVACTCLGLGVKARLSGLQTLQVKESRRIDVLKKELQKFGAIVNSTEDFLELLPGNELPGKSIHVLTHNDHRIAMSFAPLSLVFTNLSIEDPDVVKKSYPHFWKDLQSLGFRLNLQS